MLGIGVGAASQASNFSLLANTIEPGTPDTWQGTGTLNMSTVDAIRVTSFGALDDALRQVAEGLCGRPPEPRVVKGNETGPDLIATISEPGGSVQIPVKVFNDASAPQGNATLSSLTDSPYGDITTTGHNGITATTCATGGTIAGGGSYSCSFTVAIVSQPSTITDTVTATLTNDAAPQGITATDDAKVVIADVAVVPLTIVKSTSTPTLAEPGGTFSYSVKITNGSLVDTATIASITDDVAGVLTGCTDADGVLAPGESTTCTFTYEHLGNAGATFDNTVTVVASDDDQANVGGVSNTVTVGITGVDAVPLTIVKSTSTSLLAEPGGTFSYSVKITNGSLVDTATIASITDDVAGVLTGCTDADGVLAPGESTTCTFTYEHLGNAGATFDNTVTVVASDDDQANVGGLSNTVTVSLTDVASSVEVLKSASSSSVREPGADVTFTFTVKNLSVVDSVTINSLTDDIYGDLNGQGTCAVPQALAAGGSYTCSLTKFVGGVEGEVHTNVVTVGGTDDDGKPVTDTDSEVVTISGPLSADLAIVKTATPSPIGAGGEITWTLTVTNNGPGTALNVEVGDIMPSTVTVTKVSSAQFSCSNTSNVITCKKASMAVGETGTVTIVTNVPANSAGGTVTNVGTVESDTRDDNLSNNSDNASVDVVAQRPPTPTTLPPGHCAFLGALQECHTPITLPKTGSDSTGWLVQGGLWLLMFGALGMVLAHRRRHGDLLIRPDSTS